MNTSRSIGSFSLLRILPCSGFVVFIVAFLTTLFLAAAAGETGPAPAVRDNAFPACIQFSPVPAGKGWNGEKPPLSVEVQQHTLVNLVDLGFRIRRVVDVESGKPVQFRSARGGIEFRITAPFGSTRLLRITP